jgi:hypothetical protein
LHTTKETRHVSHSDRSPGMKDQRPRYEQIKMIVEAGGARWTTW